MAVSVERAPPPVLAALVQEPLQSYASGGTASARSPLASEVNTILWLCNA